MKKILFAAYIALLVVMAAATFVEKVEGSSFVHRYVYGAWWFAALWMAVASAGLACVARWLRSLARIGYKQVAVVCLHASFLLILAGALLTHLYGRSGTIHLRTGELQDVMLVEHNGETYWHRLAFNVGLTDFRVVEDNGDVVDYRSDFVIVQATRTADGRGGGSSGCTVARDTVAALSVSMNNIATYGNLRFYQMSYDSDGRGSTLMINRDPWGMPVTYCGYAMLFASFVALCLRRMGGMRLWLPCIAITAVWCLYYFVLDGSWRRIPVLRHPLLVFHVVAIILAYALLLVQTCISVWSLATHRQKIVSVVLPALCLLSIGIFLGAIWANISWGNYWSWDSKEVWALVTLMVYAIALHGNSLEAFRRPRFFHVYMVASFLTVLMTYFGVNYFLAGLHSYA